MQLASEGAELGVLHSRAKNFRWFIEQSLDGGMPLSPRQCITEIDGLLGSIIDELKDRKFTFIPLLKTDYFEHDALFGQEVKVAFPSAQQDIKEAGNCLASDSNTAAVFHLMRTVEHGLRAIAKILCVTIQNKDIEMADWHNINAAKRIKIKGIQGQPGRTIEKNKELDFYLSILDEVERFKTMRNDIMHTRGIYGPNEAQGVHDRVRDFMKRLAPRT